MPSTTHSSTVDRSSANRATTRTFWTFDGDYVRSLETGDSVVSEHFARYFGPLLEAKLRMKVRSQHLIENIRQETLLRVLEAIRVKGGIDHPERLGAYVVSVCRFVMYEQLRAESRFTQTEPAGHEPVDEREDPEQPLHHQQLKQMVAEVLDDLPERDRTILRLLFLQEVARPEICQRLGVDDNYLRVALFRAKTRFRDKWPWGNNYN